MGDLPDLAEHLPQTRAGADNLVEPLHAPDFFSEQDVFVLKLPFEPVQFFVGAPQLLFRVFPRGDVPAGAEELHRLPADELGRQTVVLEPANPPDFIRIRYSVITRSPLSRARLHSCLNRAASSPGIWDSHREMASVRGNSPRLYPRSGPGSRKSWSMPSPSSPTKVASQRMSNAPPVRARSLSGLPRSRQ